MFKTNKTLSNKFKFVSLMYVLQTVSSYFKIKHTTIYKCQSSLLAIPNLSKSVHYCNIYVPVRV